MTDVQPRFIRDVFGSADARAILLHLASASSPIRYSALRATLAIHPERFRRAHDVLEHWAMTGRILAGPANNLGFHPTYLEATALGRFWAEQWTQFEQRCGDEALRRLGTLGPVFVAARA